MLQSVEIISIVRLFSISQEKIKQSFLGIQDLVPMAVIFLLSRGTQIIQDGH